MDQNKELFLHHRMEYFLMFMNVFVFSIYKMILTRIICLFLHTSTLQARWSIYYFRRSNCGANLSLHFYHPTDRSLSKEIASFEYPQAVEYQVAPIWDCKVALVPENSTTKEVVTFNMVTKELKVEHTLLNSRIGFATKLVNRSKLYVCGGLNAKNHMCEVWKQNNTKFIDTGHKWGQEPRSSFTMHQVGRWICFFGGRWLNQSKPETIKVECFHTHGSTTSNLALTDCHTDGLQLRAKHASIRYDDTTVILCGGQGPRRTYKCGVVQINLSGGPETRTCLNPIQVNNWGNYDSFTLLRSGEDILLFGELANELTKVERQVSVVKLFAGFLGRGEEQLSLQHNGHSNIRLFNVPASCSPHINVPTQSSECSHPYHVALGCISSLCLLLLGVLVFVIVKWVIPVQMTKESMKTVKLMPKQETESSQMSVQNICSTTDLGSMSPTPAMSRTLPAAEKGRLAGVNLQSKLGQAFNNAHLTNFPLITDPTTTCVNSNSMIGSSDVCSHTNSKTYVASSRVNTCVNSEETNIKTRTTT